MESQGWLRGWRKKMKTVSDKWKEPKKAEIQKEGWRKKLRENQRKDKKRLAQRGYIKTWSGLWSKDRHLGRREKYRERGR